MKNQDKIRNILRKASSEVINPKYTHFAVYKSTGKIVDGWEYDNDLDKESIKEYCSGDIKDNFPDYKLSQFKVLTLKGLQKQGIDPFNYDQSWFNAKTFYNGGSLDEAATTVFKNEHLMKESGYPEGAEFDSNAPWNQKDPDVFFDEDTVEVNSDPKWSYNPTAFSINDLYGISVSIDQKEKIHNGEDDYNTEHYDIVTKSLSEILITLIKHNPNVTKTPVWIQMMEYLKKSKYPEEVLDEFHPVLEELIQSLFFEYIKL